MIGTYLHVPFCTLRCSYCDFYLLPKTARGADPDGRGAFVEALVAEIDRAAAERGPLQADTAHPIAIIVVFETVGRETLVQITNLIERASGDQDGHEADHARIVALYSIIFQRAPRSEETKLALTYVGDVQRTPAAGPRSTIPR